MVNRKRHTRMSWACAVVNKLSLMLLKRINKILDIVYNSFLKGHISCKPLNARSDPFQFVFIRFQSACSLAFCVCVCVCGKSGLHSKPDLSELVKSFTSFKRSEISRSECHTCKCCIYERLPWPLQESWVKGVKYMCKLKTNKCRVAQFRLKPKITEGT